MANGHEDRQLPRLPACQSCYTKKAKVCLTVSLNGSEPVSRE
ncbi:choline transport protein [Aspergillus luchuensis]|uniref:Choline transport protein n=1 Tax=Aspergillus kawachii TaxID=1069201 RepID=A0A146FG34_ASPKA|nr:choline transport protein [Aspergillus luchuensis]